MIQNTVDKVKNFLADLFYPSFCLGCKREGDLLCQDCKSTLDVSEHRYCLCSTNPLRLPSDSFKGTCRKCANKKLAGLYAALPYKEKWLTKKMVLSFKYKPYLKTIGPYAVQIIADHFALLRVEPALLLAQALLIPIPLEKSKIRERGYNQSEVLANELAKISGAKVAANVLEKIKPTKQQADLNAKERRENLQGAFAVKNSAEIIGKKIFLVDDVYTTGSTMEECASELLRAGAKSVWGIVVAREG